MRNFLAMLLLVGAGVAATATAATILERSAQQREPHRAFADPASPNERYSGDYRDGKYNGRGSLVYANGEKYVGEFRDNLRNGRGTYTWPDGRRYAGEFRDGQPHGYGTFTMANGEEYADDFRGNRREGHGVYTWPDRRRYEGEFHNDLPNGRGTIVLAGGERRVGLFRNGEFVGDTLTPMLVSAALSSQPVFDNASEIQLRRSGTNFTAAALLNGVADCEFFVDSGAADVMIPMHVFDALVRAGTIAPEDVIGLQQYRMANGAAMKSFTFRIRSLKVGPVTLQDVRASIGEQAAPLLGMSFLGRFKAWTLDNERAVLTLQ
jgi:clan AA aspartic protease (TIGR02281 family)